MSNNEWKEILKLRAKLGGSRTIGSVALYKYLEYEVEDNVAANITLESIKEMKDKMDQVTHSSPYMDMVYGKHLNILFETDEYEDKEFYMWDRRARKIIKCIK